MRGIPKTLQLIQRQARGLRDPSVTEISEVKDPYRVLVACILSLRTQDKTTRSAADRLFKIAATPQKMARLSPKRIEGLIYPVGFYRNKARVIRNVSSRILKDFAGRVPKTEEALLSFKGIGRKTANLVLGLGFGIPAICVDTHVHRISNRLGWIRTGTPQETEEALKKIIPRRSWILLNTVLVSFGQNTCKPVSPLCSSCYVERRCKKAGVRRHR